MPTFTATVTVTLTLGTSNVDQATANAARAATLVDYAKAKGLNIFTVGTQTVDPTLVGPAVDADVKAMIKAVIVNYRAGIAATTQQAIDNAGVNP